MDMLPNEILEKIFSLTDGTSFIRLRSCCSRFMDVVDNMEVTRKPSVWRRFLLWEYLLGCIESLVCLNCNDLRNLIFWKEAFVQMRKSTFHNLSIIKWQQIPFYSESLENVSELEFSDGRLVLKNNVHLNKICMTVQKPPIMLWPSKAFFDALGPLTDGLLEKLCHLTNVTEIKDMAVPDKFFCHLTNCHVPIIDVDSISSVSCHLSIFTGRALSGALKIIRWDRSMPSTSNEYCRAINCDLSLVPVAINKSWVVALNALKTSIYIASSRNFDSNINLENVSKFCTVNVNYAVVKLSVIGDLIIVLLDDGYVRSSRILMGQNELVPHVKPWVILIPHGADCVSSHISNSPNIQDFSLLGPVFAALSETGEIYLSRIEEYEPSSLQKNILKRIPLKLKPNAGTCKISLGYCGSLTIAVLERYLKNLTTRVSAVHVVYLSK